MREEIRELHEQRAGAMMSEIVELQKERDLAVAKLRRLEMKVKGKAAVIFAHEQSPLLSFLQMIARKPH